ncbi:MAG TPA: SLC13 family permease [Methylomirabilota bacterium]|nr:SLC13 family permease [Methylomirabilota bacterium]
MDWQGWFTLAVIVGTLALLARETYAPAHIMLASVVVLLVAGIITPGQAFSGFSNSAPITVAALYVLARAVERTGLLQPLLAIVLGGARSDRASLNRLLPVSAAASGFLNNTPLVAMLIPPIIDWADRTRRSASRFLMPLSYAVILGGVVTVMGTSTNLVVSGLLEAHGSGPLGLFEITPIGLPVALVGIVVLILTAPVLLPERRTARRNLGETAREFTVHLIAEPGGPLDGKAVEDAGLRHLQGVFLIQIERDGETIAPVAGNTIIKGGDRLCFVGKVDQVVDLHAVRGLVSAEQQHVTHFDTARHTFFEAVIGATSPLVGTTLKQAGFRSRYQAAVVAIHRAGERLDAKLGEVKLTTGDTLLLLTDREFGTRWRDRPDFILISQLGGTPPAVTRKAGIVGLVTVGVVLVAGLGILPMLQASLIAAGALVLFGVLTAKEARAAVDMDVILVVASAFGIGAAIEQSGLADWVASYLVGAFDGFGRLGVLLGIILATSLVTEIVTNNAAAAVMFPIALAAAERVGANPRGFAIVVAIMASTSFLTPIGYQTNTMVYGPGGYRFSDYTRLGAPLTFVVMVTILLAARWWYGL